MTGVERWRPENERGDARRGESEHAVNSRGLDGQHQFERTRSPRLSQALAHMLGKIQGLDEVVVLADVPITGSDGSCEGTPQRPEPPPR